MTPLSVSLVVACSSPPAEVREVAAQAPTERAAPSPAPSPAVDEELLDRLEALEQRVEDLDLALSRLQVVVADIENIGIGRAELVRYDPGRTAMDARDVQSALDEIAVAVHALQRAAVDMGAAGQGLFEVPEDDEGPGGAQPTGGPGHNPGPGFGVPAEHAGGMPPAGQGSGAPPPDGGPAPGEGPPPGG